MTSPAPSPEVAAAARDVAAGRLYDAETKLRDRLAAASDDVHALELLGDLADRVGRHADAEELFGHAVWLDNDFHAARYKLAVVLHRQGKSPQALEQVLVLREVVPTEPLYRALEAALRAAVGDVAESLALYERLFAEGRDGPRLRLSYGHGLKTVGRTRESAAAYRRLALSAHPEDRPLAGEAWWSLANLKVEELTEVDRKAMATALASAATPEDGRVHLHYALGKALEDAGDADTAFRHYTEGAALRRRRSRYRSRETTERVERTIAAATPDLFARRAGAGSPARDPIFVVGLPRSGSTLVEQILASHSQIEGTMELTAMPSIARDAGIEGDGADPSALGRLPPARLRELGEAYLERTRIYRKTDRPFFVDKLPNNWLYTPLIRLILPSATIVDVRRSPIASCVSAFKQLFARGQAFSYGLDDVGRYYRDYVALMDHLDRVAPGSVQRVIYEDLVDDLDGEVKRLLAAIGLPFEPACIAFHETQRAIWTPSAEQVRRPLYRDALDQWRTFDRHLDPLKAALGPVLDRWRGAGAPGG